MKVKCKMKPVWTIFLLINAIGIASGFSIATRPHTLTFETCTPYDTKLELRSLIISTCNSSPCTFPIGQVVKIHASFYNHGDPISASTFSHQPHWLLNNVYTETSMSVEIKPNAIDEEINIIATMNVSSSLPPLSGNLNWRLLDETGTRIACYNIPIQLVFA